jgi:hypothetical protein
MRGVGNFGHTEIRRGRPRTSQLVAVTFKLEPGLLARIDAEAARTSASRSDAIRALLGCALDSTLLAGNVTTAPPSSELLSEMILDEARALDAAGRHGGVVPLPELRARLTRRAPSASRELVDATLIDLERAFRIDLSVAQAPGQLDHTARAHGIARPGRGLVFYVVVR